MNQENQNQKPDPIRFSESPIELAEQLEKNVHGHGFKPNASNADLPVPDDFGIALQGLELIRRAALIDGIIELNPSSTDVQAPETRNEARADTDQFHFDPDASLQTNSLAFNRFDSNRNLNLQEPGLKHIGRYEVIRELGRGGFGVVLLGRDPELDRLVALKIPRLEMLIDTESRKRFSREANLVSTLSHPAIVPVYEYSAGPGVPFIAFAWCRGPSLADWLRLQAKPLAPMLAAKLVAQMANAMQYAHRRQVVHRDLKPGNVLLDIDEAELAQGVDDGRLVAGIRITDFGLAKSLQTASAPITREGAMVGTPSYMAPEQITGRIQVESAVDVYSLGVILYELLTGQPPLKRETDLATLRAIEMDEPVRPSQIQQTIPRDLEAVVLKCLEKNPLHRYPTPFAMQQDLENVIAGRPVLARKITRVERSVRWGRRNPVIAALAGITITAVSIALIAASAGWYSTNQALQREQMARRQADQAYRDAKSAIDTYFVTVSENRLLTAPGLKPLRQELLNDAVVYYSQFIEQHRDDDELFDDLIKAYLYRASIDDELGNYQDARNGYETVIQMLVRLDDRTGLDRVLTQQAGPVLRKLAKLDRQSGDTAAALKKIEQALKLNHSLLQADENSATVLGEIGQLLSLQANIQMSSGQLNESLESHLQSSIHFEQAQLLEPENDQWEHFLTQSKGNLAHLYQQAGDILKATQLFDEVSTRLSQLIERFPDQLTYQVDRGKALAGLSTAQRAMGQPQDGLNSLWEATRVFDRLASIHPQVVMYHAFRSGSRNQAAEILNNLDRLEECETMLIESLEILKDVPVQASGNTLIQQAICSTQVGLGRLYQQLGNRELARNHLQSAITGLERDYLSNPGNMAVGGGLAEALQQLGLVTDDHSQAVQMLDRGQTILETLQKARPDNPAIAGMLHVNRETRRMLSKQNE